MGIGAVNGQQIEREHVSSCSREQALELKAEISRGDLRVHALSLTVSEKF
jgi:hypothetical protein